MGAVQVLSRCSFTRINLWFAEAETKCIEIDIADFCTLFRNFSKKYTIMKKHRWRKTSTYIIL
jgi:hypothetical protein